MKRILLLVITFASLNSYAQNSKEEVYSKIESSYAWLNFKMLETFATINMSEENWTWILKNKHFGLSSVNRLGNDMINYYELTTDKNIASQCRYTNSEECISRINDMPNKIFVEMNASNLKPAEINRKLAMQALSTISGFIGNNNIYGTKAGWKPKTNSTKFILNIDNGTGQPKAVWSVDGGTVTITMYVGSEAPDWNANLLKKLHTGK